MGACPPRQRLRAVLGTLVLLAGCHSGGSTPGALDERPTSALSASKDPTLAQQWTPVDPDTVAVAPDGRWQRELTAGDTTAPGFTVRYVQETDSTYFILWGRERAERRIRLYVGFNPAMPDLTAATRNWLVFSRPAGTGVRAGLVLPLGDGKVRWLWNPMAVSPERELLAFPEAVDPDAAPVVWAVYAQPLTGGPSQAIAELPYWSLWACPMRR